MNGIDHDLLSAYLDGALDDADTRRVEAVLRTDAQARRTLEAMRKASDLVRAAHLAQRAPAKPRPAGTAGRRWRWAAGGVALAASAVVAAVLTLRPAAVEDPRHHMLEEVAAYHTLYARETEHLVEVGADRKEHLEAWLGDRLRKHLVVPDLSGEGWTFEGGRMLAAGDAPIAQLLYTAPGRQPIALCIMRSDAADSDPDYVESYGLRVASWDDAGYLLVVVGDLQDSEIRNLVRVVRATT